MPKDQDRPRPASAMPSTQSNSIFGNFIKKLGIHYGEEKKEVVLTEKGVTGAVVEGKYEENRVYKVMPVGSSRDQFTEVIPQPPEGPKFRLLASEYDPSANLLQKKGTNFYEIESTRGATSSPNLPPGETQRYEKSRSIFQNDHLKPSKSVDPTSRIYLKAINSDEVNRQFPSITPNGQSLRPSYADSSASNSRIAWANNPIGSNRSHLMGSSAYLANFSNLPQERAIHRDGVYRPYSPINTSRIQNDSFRPTMKTERFGRRQIVAPNEKGTLETTRSVILDSVTPGPNTNSLGPNGMSVTNMSGISSRSKSPGGPSIFANGSRVPRQAREGPQVQLGTVSIPGKYTYEGEMLEGLFEGQGKMIFPDGSTFIGRFKAGNKSGFGRQFNAEGGLESEGYYENDKLI